MPIGKTDDGIFVDFLSAKPRGASIQFFFCFSQPAQNSSGSELERRWREGGGVTLLKLLKLVQFNRKVCN